MWQANLDYKTERTDGAIDLFITYFDGTHKYQKQHTLQGDFDLQQIVKTEIARATSLFEKTDGLSSGVITVEISPPPLQAEGPIADLLLLFKMHRAVDLGLLETTDKDYLAQRDKVLANPDYLKLL